MLNSYAGTFENFHRSFSVAVPVNVTNTGKRRSWSQPSMSTKSTPKSLALPYVVEFSSGMSPRARFRLGLELATWKRLRPQRPRQPQPMAVTVRIAFCRSESESWISVSPRSFIAAQLRSRFTRDRQLIMRVTLPAFRLFLVPRIEVKDWLRWQKIGLDLTKTI